MIGVSLLDVALWEAPMALWILEQQNAVVVKQYETARGLEWTGSALH